MEKKKRTRHMIYLKTKILFDGGMYKVHTFAFRTMLKAKSFIEKLQASGLITNA